MEQWKPRQSLEMLLTQCKNKAYFIESGEFKDLYLRGNDSMETYMSNKMVFTDISRSKCPEEPRRCPLSVKNCVTKFWHYYCYKLYRAKFQLAENTAGTSNGTANTRSNGVIEHIPAGFNS